MSFDIFCSIASQKPGWNQFLTSLVRAERAAADQCDFIAGRMHLLKRPELAQSYYLIGQQEREHIGMIQELCRGAVALPPRAEAVYQGKLLSENASLLERMAVFHLAFETSALSFLGYLYPRVEEHFRDAGLGRQIRQNFAEILRQEVGHIADGKTMVLELLAGADPFTRQTVVKSLHRHHTFLRVGLKSFFKGQEGPFLQKMIKNYQRHYQHAVAGVV